jgi:type III restriction enzyme
MNNKFFEQPILNSPYEYPMQHWELDKDGQPTQRVVEYRRRADFVTPIPKAKKRGKSTGKTKDDQRSFVIDEGLGLSSEKQQYSTTAMINMVREQVDQWRKIPDR